MTHHDISKQGAQIFKQHHRHFGCTDSTNSQLIADIASGQQSCDEPHLYTASTQTAGRGQHGRTWLSADGNVFLSLYTPIGTPEHTIKLKQLSGMLALAVGFFLYRLPIIQEINAHRSAEQLPLIGLKWANDVGLYEKTLNKFLKLAGILIEPVFKKTKQGSTLVGAVTGVGLNVQNAPIITDGLYQAVSLKDLLPDTHNLPHAHALYPPIVHAILQAVMTCNRLDDSNHLVQFVSNFNQAHVLTNHWVHIFVHNDTKNIATQGKCLGIDTQGGLILQTEQGTCSIFAGMAQLQQDK